MIKPKQLVKRHKKALALWVFWLVLAALLFSGLVPRPVMFYGQSMQPTIGSVAITLVDTKTPFEQLQEGDIIVFSQCPPNQNVYGENQSTVYAHRVYYIDKEDGTITTMGDNNEKEKECKIEVHNKNDNLIETLKKECQQIGTENVKKNQYLGKVVWWITIIP